MYFADVEADSGELAGLCMVSTQVKRFRVNRAFNEDADWLQTMLNREVKRFGTQTLKGLEGKLTLTWI